MGSPVSFAAFSLFEWLPVQIPRGRRTIVACENNQRVVRESCLIDGVNQFADELVHVSDVAGEERFFASRGIVLVLWRCRMWTVSEQHWVVDEKWFLPLASDEIDQEGVDRVRAI